MIFGIMKLVTVSLFIVLIFMSLCIGSDSRFRNENTVSYNYDRIDEVKNRCAFVLKSASELKPDDSRLYRITEELSFLNGDWWQDLNGEGAPLMPFDDKDLNRNSINSQSPANLVTFWVSDVSRSHRSRNSIFISGILQMGITLEGLFTDKPDEKSPRFDIWPGHSQLSVRFEGIYAEWEKNHGERVMCLLGNTMLPSRQDDSGNPWGWVKEFGYTNQPILAQDDQILLVLRYPKTFSLTSRAIVGSMKSLNSKSNLKYFDEVHISSWLGKSVNYEFGSENVVSKACDPYPYKDSSMNSEINVYKGLEFCVILERLTHQQALTILPNWKCNGTDEFCSKLGPFAHDEEINATDGGFKDVKLVLQDVHCEKMTLKDNADFTRVSSVFRVVLPSQNQFTVAQRTGLNNMTLSAEGIWKPSSGQLCMIGCSGIVNTDGDGCDSRVCLYVPLTFSIKQRSILMGTFYSIEGSKRSYFPLAFTKPVRPSELWDQETTSHPHYKYSKIDAAGAVLEKNEPFSFATAIKKSLLKFPKVDDNEPYVSSLSLLSEDLTLHIPAVSDPFPNLIFPRTDVEMEIISIGPLFGRYWSPDNTSSFSNANPHKDEYTEKQLMMNVSAQLSLAGKEYANISSLSVEGIYDPLVGKMYLIGCRDIRASWKILFESMDLEAGLDCLIELVVSYPPTTSRWLVNPTARISVSSQRNEDDPLYFPPLKLQTFPIMYRKQREDILSRRGMEGLLRVLTLTFIISCIFSQLLYVRENVDPIPYTSLVMLGVEAIGYSIPLITGAEALFRMADVEIYENQSYDLQNSQAIRVVDYAVKILVLVAFSLTLRLCQKVWKSRIRLLTRTPLEPHRVPSDKQVLVTTLIIHSIGFILVLIVHSANTSHKPLQTDSFIDSTGYSQTIREWEVVLEEYMGLIRDFFLLPQVIGNLIWRVQCKPLRKLYYMGITLVRLLPHAYDYTRSPFPNPYFSQEYEFANPRLDFYSKFGDIAIPAIEVILAFVVYAQQRWSSDTVSRTLTMGRAKLLPLGSKVYERLPSMSIEAELASGVNRDATHEKEDDEE